MSQFIEMYYNTHNKQTLESVCPIMSKGITPKYVESSSVLVINQACIHWDGQRLGNIKYHNEEIPVRKRILESGDVLLNATGNGTLGRCCVFICPSDNNTYINDGHVIALSTDRAVILPEVLNTYLSLNDTQAEIYRQYVTGSTNQVDIVFSDIKKMKVPVPSMDEQILFVEVLKQADKSEFVGCKSQFIEMFKEKGYPLRMLKSFADVSTGGTPSKANLEYWNGDKPWVSAEDMKNKYVYDTCEKVTEAGYATCKIIPVDTLMYVCRGSIGVMAINKIECATNQSICRAKCHDNVCNVEFLYHALMYQEDNIKKMGTGTSFKSLNQTSFSELKIELPPYNEQMKFVSIAQQADKSEFVGCKSQFIEMFGNQNTNDKGWTESLVKDEFKLSMGKTPARNNPECWDNGTHKWVSISDMSSYTRYTGDTSEYITDYAIADSGIKAVPKGTIIMSFKLSIGRTAITSEDLYTNEAIMAFAGFDEKKFNIDFLHFLIANKNWLLGAKQAVKGQTLNKESIGNAKIIIPPIEAQEEFASIYNQADKSEYYN